MGALVTRIASERIEDIYKSVTEQKASITNFGLSDGLLGSCLLDYFYFVHIGDQKYLAFARANFNKACDMINDGTTVRFAQEYVELAVVTHYLCNKGVLDVDPDIFLSDVDMIIHQKMRKAIKKGNFVGTDDSAIEYGFYFLQRILKSKKPLAIVLEEFLVLILKSLANVGAGWHNKSAIKDHLKVCLAITNCSFSVLLFLVCAAELRIRMALNLEKIIIDAANRLTSCLEQTQSSMLRRRSDADSMDSQCWLSKKMDIGCLLFRCGTILNNEDWLRQGGSILSQCSLETHKFMDGKLQARAFGGYVECTMKFERIHRFTKDHNIEVTSKLWYLQLLKLDSFGPFNVPPAVSDKDSQGFRNLGFKNGSIGIAASLIKFLHPDSINFEEILGFV